MGPVLGHGGVSSFPLSKKTKTKNPRASAPPHAPTRASDRSQEQDDALMVNTQEFQAWRRLHAREPQVTTLFEESNPEWYFQTHKRHISALLGEKAHCRDIK